jgi:hypothetical protein
MDDPTAPFPGSVLWPDPSEGPWLVTVDWRIQFGVPTPVGLSIRSYTSGKPSEAGLPLPGPLDPIAFDRLEGRTLKALPFASIVRDTMDAAKSRAAREITRLDRAREASSAAGDHLAAGAIRYKRGSADQVIKAELTPHGRDLGDAHYAEVARIYRLAAGTGAPTRAVAEHFTIDKSTAAKQVARARARGFLPPTTRGRVGRGDGGSP